MESTSGLQVRRKIHVCVVDRHCDAEVPHRNDALNRYCQYLDLAYITGEKKSSYNRVQVEREDLFIIISVVL